MRGIIRYLSCCKRLKSGSLFLALYGALRLSPYTFVRTGVNHVMDPLKCMNYKLMDGNGFTHG